MNACANKSITMLSIRIRLILCACVALHQTSIVTQISVWTVNDKSDLYHEQNYDLNTRTGTCSSRKSSIPLYMVICELFSRDW
jgi:hypothetical protein